MLIFLCSLAIYLANFTLVISLRTVLKKILSKDFYPYVAELLSSFLIVANVHENGNVFNEYHISIYSGCLFSLILLYASAFDGYANPVSIFDLVWNRKMSLSDGIFKIMAQIIGALLAAKYMKWLWKAVALAEYQVNRAEFLTVTCESANKVSIPEAMIVELLGTLILRIIASYGMGGEKFERHVNAVSTIFVVIAGLEWTGSMLNPALATAMTYNCENHPFYEHLLVYWLAPFAGSAISDKIEDFLHGPGWRDKTSVVKDEVGVIKNGKKKRPARRYSKGKKNNSSEISVVPNGKSQKEQNGHVARRRKRANGKKALNNNVQS